MVKNTECLNTTNCCVFKCSNVAMLPLFLIHEDVPKACFKNHSFSQNNRRKETL